MEQQHQQEIIPISKDFSCLPAELLRKIGQHLVSYGDYLRFRSVCINLGITILPLIPSYQLPPQMPLLLLPQTQPTSIYHPYFFNYPIITTHPFRTFHRLTTTISNVMYLPECTFPNRIIGSSNGYLIVTSHYTPEISCFNPITNSRIQLPPITSFPGVLGFSSSQGLQVRDLSHNYNINNNEEEESVRTYLVSPVEMQETFIRKMVFSDTVAFAVITCHYKGYIATQMVYCRINRTTPGNNDDDNVWEPVLVPGTWDRNIEDVIYCSFDGCFYVVNTYGDVGMFKISYQQGNYNGLFTCNVDRIRKRNTTVGQLPKGRRYLAWHNKQKKLLLLIREYHRIWPNPPWTGSFQVYEAAFNKQRQAIMYWKRLEGRRQRWLDDTMFFVGRNESLALSASDFRGGVGKWIYFTDERTAGAFYDVGLYDDFYVHPLPYFQPNMNEFTVIFESPLLFTPNPQS